MCIYIYKRIMENKMETALSPSVRPEVWNALEHFRHLHVWNSMAKYVVAGLTERASGHIQLKSYSGLQNGVLLAALMNLV